MQNKPAPKSWNEIEMLISAIAIALTLGLWNLFASAKKPSVASADVNANLPSQPDTSTVVSITPTPSFMLLPGQVLLLGGVLPTPTAGQPTTLTTTSNNARGSKKNGGGGGVPPSTHSSHP
jgi:hypothetical protein